MSRWPLWAVLTPGEPKLLERRIRAALMLEEEEGQQEEGKTPSFEVIQGRDRYHAIVGTDPSDVGAEFQIAKNLSLEIGEPVYSIERANDPWAVTLWKNGALEVLEEDPETLAEFLGCPLPGSKDSSSPSTPPPLQKVVLVEGTCAHDTHRMLEGEAGTPPTPGQYRLKDTQQGTLISSGTSDIGYADLTVSERLSLSLVYGVIASPNLDVFFVNVLMGGECVGQFAQPPYEVSHFPVLNDIKGERLPERILAALGIPAEWFRNE